MPHEQGGIVPKGAPPSKIKAVFKGQPIKITSDENGDLRMNVPEPHTMVTVGRVGRGRRHEQQMQLFTAIGLDRSEEEPNAPIFEGGIITGVEVRRPGSEGTQRIRVSGKCEIRIFFVHP